MARGFNMKSKKAVSDILSSILIIIVAVALVSFVSFFLIGLVKNMEINVNPGTFYIRDACYESPSDKLSVYVGRAIEDDSDLEFVGITVHYKVEGKEKYLDFDLVPSKGAVSGYIVPFVDEKPERISVSPILLKNEIERRGSVTYTFTDIETSDNCLKSEGSLQSVKVEGTGLKNPGTPGELRDFLDS
jgi:hypothetical protein